MRYYVYNRGVVKSFRNVLSALTDLELRNELCQEHVGYLESVIDKLKRNQSQGIAQGMQTFSDVRVNTVIKMEYILYIQKYGMPDDGIFLPTRLMEFMGASAEPAVLDAPDETTITAGGAVTVDGSGNAVIANGATLETTGLVVVSTEQGLLDISGQVTVDVSGQSTLQLTGATAVQLLDGYQVVPGPGGNVTVIDVSGGMSFDISGAVVYRIDLDGDGTADLSLHANGPMRIDLSGGYVAVSSSTPGAVAVLDITGAIGGTGAGGEFSISGVPVTLSGGTVEAQDTHLLIQVDDEFSIDFADTRIDIDDL